MLPVLQVGPLAVQLPGLLLLAGVWVGSTVAERWAKRFSLAPELVANLIFYGLIAGLLGARIGYVLRHFSLYLQHPLGIIALNPSTLALSEGLLVAGLVALAYGQRKGLPLWDTLDALAPAFAAFGIALGLAHLASGDAFGAPSELPWAIELWGARRHPTQVYEILLAAGILGLLWRFGGRRPFSGAVFLAWAGLTGAAQLLLGGLRGDSVIVFGSLRQGQLVGLLVLLLAMLLLHLRARGELKAGVAQKGASG